GKPGLRRGYARAGDAFAKRALAAKLDRFGVGCCYLIEAIETDRARERNVLCSDRHGRIRAQSRSDLVRPRVLEPVSRGLQFEITFDIRADDAIERERCRGLRLGG